METVVHVPDPELHLLTEWTEPGRSQRTRAAAVLSVLVHAGIILLLAVIPQQVLQPQREPERIVTPLIEPLTELTQKEPNTGKISKEFNAVEKLPRPRLQAPASPPPVEHAAAPAPPAPAPKPAQAPPEPPKVEAAVKAPPKIDLPPMAAPPPPQIQPEEKPKLTFESPPAPTQVAPGRSKVPIPGSPVQEAIRQAARNSGTGGTGDGGVQGVGGIGGAINIPAAPGLQGGSIQLLSDPMGVDFRPYLNQILATVRRNWMAVMPESVKLGRRGRTAIQFSVGRSGGVIKLVIAESSGADPLDRAAVAGISASNPFPPLPTEFKGDRVVLQFNFAYNMPRQ
jgi:TonB family protein